MRSILLSSLLRGLHWLFVRYSYDASGNVVRYAGIHKYARKSVRVHRTRCSAQTEAMCPLAEPEIWPSLVIEPFSEPECRRSSDDVIGQVVAGVESLAQSERRLALSSLVNWNLLVNHLPVAIVRSKVGLWCWVFLHFAAAAAERCTTASHHKHISRNDSTDT